MMNRRGFMVSGVTGLGAMAVQSTSIAEAAQTQPMSLNVIPAMADVRADLARFTDIKPTIMLGKSS